MGIVALVIFIAVTVVWNGVLKRGIAEALLLSLLCCSLAGGTDALVLLKDAVLENMKSDITFAGMAFVFMGAVVAATGLIQRLIQILNSLFGRLRGGAGYVSTLGSALIGLVAGSTAGNTATVGSVTIPWMKASGWSAERSATLVAGNSGLGVALPPNSTMFILIATPGAAGVATGDVYVSLGIAGAYFVLYRLALVFFWSRRLDRDGAATADILPLRQTWSGNWPSTLIFLGVLVPVALTFGPLFDWLSEPERIGEAAMDTINIIVWVPILITAIALLEGRKRILADPAAVLGQVRRELPQFATVGISLFAALSASSIMEALGVADQVTGFLDGLDAPKAILILLVCLITVVVATPLSSTATAAAVGAPAILAMTAVGVPPVVAIVTVLLCTSTEGSSPPVGAPIYLASGFAETNPTKTFVPLITYFVVPAIVMAWLVGMGFLPIPS